AVALPGEQRVLEAAHRSLAEQRGGLRGLWPFLGPAFIAAIAYVDPGNFATNIASGSKYGYLLLWVILVSNLMAMLIQTMSAKLGIATGYNLAEIGAERFPNPVRIFLWLQAEAVAMACDLAEFVGAALGFHLLFGMPLLPAGLLTGVVVFAILAAELRGVRHLEAVIAVLVAVILAGFAFQMIYANPDGSAVVKGLLTPKFADSESVLLAAGILGATVMPHVIYLHSSLTQRRVIGANENERKRIFRFEQIDVVIAMTIAGLVNMAMLVMAAGVFHSRGLTQIGDIDEAYRGLGTIVGHHADLIFGIALLASGLASSSVGTLAGQVVMQGYIRRQIPLFLRRIITMAPSIVILAIGVNPSSALIVSQIALSFGIPFALIPLVIFCRNRELMGDLVNRRGTNIAAYLVVGVIVALNLFLIYQTVLG
ncbi:MAG: manganese transport protein, partial [Gaiellales bacterium]|nr:manganese transport protein [Gaiellales bacterium]